MKAKFKTKVLRDGPKWIAFIDEGFQVVSLRWHTEESARAWVKLYCDRHGQQPNR